MWCPFLELVHGGGKFDIWVVVSHMSCVDQDSRASKGRGAFDWYDYGGSV